MREWKVKAAVIEWASLGITTQTLIYSHISSLEFMELHRAWSKHYKSQLNVLYQLYMAACIFHAILKRKKLLFKVTSENTLKYFGSPWSANTCIDWMYLSKEEGMLAIVFTLILKQEPQFLISCRKGLPSNQELVYVNINTVSILL